MKKYQHIERLDSDACEGLLDGICYVFPKLDGANASVYIRDGELKCASRNRELTGNGDDTLGGFYNYVRERETQFRNLINCFRREDVTIYGEWLIPHTIKHYRDDAWRKFYIFDVVIFGGENKFYVPYGAIKEGCDVYGIEYIPCMAKIENPKDHDIEKVAKGNTYLCKEGRYGEGVVVKNYHFTNRFGRTIWGKYVLNDFKDEHMKNDIRARFASQSVEEKIVNEYVTKALVEKERDKLPEWSNKQIPRLLGTVWYCLITEHIWDAIKKYKNPKVNFKTLNGLCIKKTKEIANIN